MSASGDSLAHKLNSTVPLLHVKFYIVIVIVAAICIALISLLIFLCIRLNRSLRIRKMRVKHSSGSIPLVSKEILEVRVEADHDRDDSAKLNEVKIGNLDLSKIMVKKKKKQSEEEVEEKEEEEEDDGVNHDSDDVAGDSDASASVDNIGWGRWYGLKELDIATRGFAEENVIGEGGYGVVYRGVLSDGSVVAVKNLLNNKYI